MPKVIKPLTPDQKLSRKKDLYVEKLLIRFGVNNLLGSFTDLKKPTQHICMACKRKFKVTPNILLTQSQPLCKKCISCRRSLRVLSFDPGLNNFAFSAAIYKFKKDKLRRIIIDKYGFIKNPIRNMAGEVNPGIIAYTKEIKSLIKEFKPDIVVIERFQIRGRFMGLTAELVPLMMGILFYMLNNMHIFFFPVTAASWKNELKRRTGLELKVLYKTYIPHLVDAFCLGAYKANNDSVYRYIKRNYKKLFMEFKSAKQKKLEQKLLCTTTKK